MKIGVLSDTHGRVDAVDAALAQMRLRGVELLIHCGDIDDAATVQAFAGWVVHFVFGNCDSDRAGIALAIKSIGGTLHDPFGHLELAGKQIAWCHGDRADVKRDIEASEHYDYVFYGHTHIAEQHLVGRTTVINAGALFRARPRTCLALELTTGHADSIALSSRLP